MGHSKSLLKKKNQTMKGVMYKESAVQMIVDFSILIPEIQKQ